MAGKLVNMGSLLKCSQGIAPTPLVVLVPTVMGQGPQAANIMDCVPMANIPTFGMCMSPANPMVIAATAAALGVLTPMPCIPVTTPWMPGSPTVLVRNFPALDASSKCMCAYAGEITITTTDVIVDVG
ncbi:MAG: DUF4280 domain-containing protein [Planctomycetota bacterium]|nr:MAG: DUF4280 domain-containing protein [Planctomycetota bacterium]